ncbi:ABC transporter transmembrane domain-containing protein, partial [Blastococcus deserti]
MPDTAFADVRLLPLYGRLFRYALRRWLALLAVVGAMLLDVAMMLLRPWPMAIVVDSVLGTQVLPPALRQAFESLPGEASKDNLLLWAVLATGAVFLLEWSVGVLLQLARVSFGQRMQYDLAADLLGHLQRLSLRFHARRGVGDLIRRVTTDSACVSAVVRDAALPVLTAVVGLVSMFLVLYRIDPVLTVVALAVVPPLGLVMWLLARPMAARDYALQEAEGRLYRVVEETLSAVPTVQAFSGEASGDRRMHLGTQDVLRRTLDQTRTELWFKVGVGSATAVGTASVTWIGAGHALAGDLSVGEILVFLAYLSSLYGPLHALVYSGSTLQSAAGSVFRVVEVLEAEPEVADGPGVG